MALLVTIGNICILGNFQLGIWGILANVIGRSIADKHCFRKKSLGTTNRGFDNQIPEK